MQDDAPSVKVLKARIRSLEGQQRVVARDLTDRDPNRDDTLSRQLGSYEQLESERRFAEAAYQHALHGLDQARANADRQQVYIASFVPPSLPEEALYPRRWRSLAVVALIDQRARSRERAGAGAHRRARSRRIAGYAPS